MARPNANTKSGFRFNKGDKVKFAMAAKQSTVAGTINTQWEFEMTGASYLALGLSAAALFVMAF